MTRHLFLAAVFLAAAVVLSGCGGREKLYDVSGTITFDGKPIPKGLIFFDPDSSKGTQGTQGFANILNGKYNTAEQGKGIKGGSYVIRISGFDGKEAPEAPFGMFLFPEYQDRKELPAQTQTLDINVPRRR